MSMKIAKLKDYEIIDASLGQKYERWNDVYLLRPDPLVMWDNGDLSNKKLDAIYYRSNKGGGHWENKREIKNFRISYNDLKFNLKQMGLNTLDYFQNKPLTGTF